MLTSQTTNEIIDVDSEQKLIAKEKKTYQQLGANQIEISSLLSRLDEVKKEKAQCLERLEPVKKTIKEKRETFKQRQNSLYSELVKIEKSEFQKGSLLESSSYMAIHKQFDILNTWFGSQFTSPFENFETLDQQLFRLKYEEKKLYEEITEKLDVQIELMDTCSYKFAVKRSNKVISVSDNNNTITETTELKLSFLEDLNPTEINLLDSLIAMKNALIASRRLDYVRNVNPADRDQLGDYFKSPIKKVNTEEGFAAEQKAALDHASRKLELEIHKNESIHKTETKRLNAALEDANRRIEELEQEKKSNAEIVLQIGAEQAKSQETKKLLDERTESLSEVSNRLSDLQRQYAEKEAELTSLTEKSQALDQVEQALEAAAAKVKVLEQQDAEKGASLSEKSQALVQAEQALEALRQENAEKEAALTKALANVTAFEQQDAAKGASLSEKSQALVQAEQALEAATAKVKVLEQQDAAKGASLSEKSQALVQAEQALEAATAKVKVLEQQDVEKGASLSEKSQALVQAEQAIKAAKERVTVLEQQDTDNRTMLSQTVKTVDDLRQDKKEIAERLDKATATVEELQKQAAQRGSVVTEETLQQQKTAFEKERGKYQALIKQRDDLIAFLKQDLIEIKTQLIKEVKAHKRTISGRENSINDTSVSSTPILVRYNPNASISSVASSRNASPISSSTPTQKQ